jgi:putative ABC transport system permease protein
MTSFERRDRDLAEEIRQHLDEAVEDLVERGVPREEAVSMARRQFGNVTLIAERSREVWRWRLPEETWADLRYAARQLRRAPSFAAAAIATLAIGIGATAAIFSIANAALLNPLPFPGPDRLVTINEIVPLIGDRPVRLTAPDLLDYASQNRTFDAIAGWTPRTFELSGARESERVQAVRATAPFFDVLGVHPSRGRTFTTKEDDDGVAVCVISHGLWQRWFGGDPGVLDRTIDLDRIPYRVIGVMPRGFEFPLRGTDARDATDVWVPMSLTLRERDARADNWDYNGIGRMKPGVTVAQATADVNAIAQRIVKDVLPADRAAFLTFTAIAQPLAAQVSGRVRPLVLALAGAVACVLLIACVNVANLLLARGAHRRREMAVRAARGAGRARILRQLIAETLLFSVVAAVIGALLAWWSTAALARIVPDRFAIFGIAHVNWTVLAFIAGIAIAAAVLAGLAPGLAAGSRGLDAMNERAGSGSAGHRRLRAALVVAEMALALALLVGAGLLVRTFQTLLQTNAGFHPEGAVSAFISLPETDYPDAPRERQIYRGLIERLHARPGVTYAGIGSTLPLNGLRSQRAFWPEHYVPQPGARFNIAAMTAASPEYLQAVGATLLRGRLFTPQDDGDAAPVAIVTESLARQYWPGADAVGKRLKWGIRDSPSPWLTVVGVVADVKQEALDAAGTPQVYVPTDQLERAIVPNLAAAFVTGQLRAMYVVVRGSASEEALAAALRESVQGLDARLAVAKLAPLTDAVSTSAAPQRFNMALMSGFAAIAVLLASVGLYGLLAYSVAQRTREIGIRMAMGAAAGSVVRMILREGLMLAAVGILLGAVAAALLAPALRSLLFGVEPLDVPTFLAVATLLLVVAALATWVPARRATMVDPTTALRAE